MEILDIKDLSFTYPLCEKPVLDGISLSVNEGELIVLCGATGCGKSTLLRMLKTQLSPLGEKKGSISFFGKPIEDASPFDIGFVMQRPEQQTVTDKVWHEIAFGLENMRLPSGTIRKKTAELAAYFGIEDWYDKKTDELSGGQKQLLNLASVMVTDPKLLILDEPTAQLDPIAASELINTIKKLSRDLSLTVIIAEHRLEELIPICDRMIIMSEGGVLGYGRPESVIAGIYDKDEILCGMPAAARLCAAIGKKDCVLDVRSGRELIRSYPNVIKAVKTDIRKEKRKYALEFENICFRYSRNTPDVLRELTFGVYEGEIFCILGGNGSGKTTALSAACGVLKPYSGKIRIFGKRIKDYRDQSLYKECCAMLPQDVQTVFLRNTVKEELSELGDTPLPFDIGYLYDRHPYDLSGGEQQLVALAKKPKLLLLDEPTKGLDAFSKKRMTEILRALKSRGVTIVTVTHDVEFAAELADRCALFFRGEIVSDCPPEDFFSENNFYTTAASRMTRGHFEKTVTVEKAAELCRLNMEQQTLAERTKK